MSLLYFSFIYKEKFRSLSVEQLMPELQSLFCMFLRRPKEAIFTKLRLRLFFIELRYCEIFYSQYISHGGVQRKDHQSKKHDDVDDAADTGVTTDRLNYSSNDGSSYARSEAPFYLPRAPLVVIKSKICPEPFRQCPARTPTTPIYI